MKEKILFFLFKFLLLLFTISIIEIKSQVSLYTFGSSSGTYSSISTGTNLYTGAWTDAVTTNVPIGFNFYFNGKNYSTCSVSTNGFITLGTTAPTSTDYWPISTTSGFEASISAVGFDLSGNTGSTISYSTQGTAPYRHFIVQYSNVTRHNVNGDAFSFQIRLNETSNTVEFIYGDFTVSNSVNSRVQIGLRGLNNNDFNNRSLTYNTSWNTATVSGTEVSDDVRLRSSAYPSSGRTFTWTPPPVCSGNPSVTGTKSRLYINSFQFVGVLNNTPAHTSGFSSTGYENHTGVTPAQQPQGSVINISASRGTSNGSNGFWKAWVDWNNDGDFDFSSEEVYSLLDYTTPSLTFGFIIPANQPVGNYKLRIATTNSSANFSPCASNITIGEFEDYLFTVVKDCSAKVISVNTVNEFDGERCGPGSVRLSAEGTASAVNFNWYDYDSSTNTYIYKATGITYNTDVLTSTHTFYVKAITNNDSGASDYCETAFYYPVVARIDPQPKVTFSSNKPSICGEDDPTLLVTAAGDKYQDVIFEKFDSGLGVFSNITVGASFTDPSNGNNISNWLNKPSPYQPKDPPYQGLSPALSSGYFGDNFAMMNTDIARNSTTQIIINHLISQDLNITGYNDLHIDFNMYYFSIATNDNEGFIKAEYQIYDSSAGTWSSWTELLKKNNSEVANPLYWEKFSFDITPVLTLNTTALRIRFTMKSYSGPMGSGSGFIEGITAVDNVRVYGFKNITTPFAWSSATTTLYKSDCVSALGGALESTVCVKPTATELEDVNWALNASATFSNGCPAIGNFTVNNDTKTWRQPGTDWNQGAQWKPSSVPTIAKCVIVRTPVELPSLTTGTHGLAKSVIVKSGGKLTIDSKSSLTIQNYLKNEAAASDVLVESDANLKQNNDASVNEGNITVKRNANLQRLDYNYWGSPVKGQTFKPFSPYTKITRFYTYDPRDDSFVTVADLNSEFIEAKGYAIMSPDNYNSTTQIFEGKFVGMPNNGVKQIALDYSAHPVTGVYGGRNMIANPYPSNIDLKKLAQKNAALTDGIYYFWTTDARSFQNNVTATYGIYGNYKVNQYAILNALGSTPATASATSSTKLPSHIIKPGQGFIIQAKAAGNLVFDNSIRTVAVKDDVNRDAVFFNRIGNAGTTKKTESLTNEDIIGRYWLALISPVGAKSVTLVGYVADATNDFDAKYDTSIAMSSSDNFYTMLGTKKNAIQGRSPLDIKSDRVSLGMSNFITGKYTIKLENKDGVFANGQNVYVKDNQTGIIQELKDSEGYSFETNAGVIEGRFEIIYQNESTLVTQDVVKDNGVMVYRDNNALVIKSNSIINQVELFDVAGVLIYRKDNISKKQHMIYNNLINGFYFLKIIDKDGVKTRKISYY